MGYVFVSHSTVDDAIVDRIVTSLNAAHIETWVDHCHGIQPGDIWSQEIHQAVHNCQYGLFVLSPAACQSNYCEAEWNRILELKKTLYVILVEPVPQAEIPLRLGIIQCCNLYDRFEEGLAELVHAIKGGLELNPKSPTTKQVRRITGRINPLLTIPLSGRNEDLQKVLDLLHERPAVAIVGIGGMGKSRLAYEVIKTDQQTHGAVWHVADETSHTSSVINLLRDHFELPKDTDPSDIIKRLAHTPTLIVIDNAEAVAEGPRRQAYIELINDLCNVGAKVLLTGRAEWGWDELPFVNLYHPKRELSVEAAQQMVLDIANYYHIEEVDLYSKVLAIKARQHAKLIEIAVRLIPRFGGLGVVERLHELNSPKLEDALDEMISKTVRQMVSKEGADKEQALKRLNVCRGGFDYNAAGLILGLWDGEKYDVRRLDAQLETLQAWQFVTLGRLDDGRPRYEIDPLVITAVGEDVEAHSLHFTRYLFIVQQITQRQVYHELEIENANLETAFEWALRTDVKQAMDFFNACVPFLKNRGYFVQMMRWIEHIVSLSGTCEENMRANVHNSLGLAYNEYPFGLRNINFTRAINAFEEALKYSPPERVPLDYAMTQNNLGNVYCEFALLEDPQGNLNKAMHAFNEALKYYTLQDAPHEYALTMANVSHLYRQLATLNIDPIRNLMYAIRAISMALEATPSDTPLTYGTRLVTLGEAYRTLSRYDDRPGNLENAITAYEEALNYLTIKAAPHDYAVAQNDLGLAYRSLAMLTNDFFLMLQAQAAFEETLKYFTAESSPYRYAVGHANLGLVFQNLRNTANCIASWREAEKYFRLSGYEADADKILGWIIEAENS